MTSPSAETDAVPAPSDGARPAKVRRAAPIADMGRSLGLVLAIVAVLLVVGPARALLFPGKDKRPAVDYSQQLAAFGRAAGDAALLPVGLPSDWQPNGATFHAARTVTRLHIGWVTPGAHYAGLDESTGPAPALIRAVLGRSGAHVTGTADIGGLAWQQRVSARGEAALTHSAGGVTVVLTGDATPQQLQTLAAALR